MMVKIVTLPKIVLDLGTAQIFSAAIFVTYFSNHRAIWINGTDYCVYLYVFLLNFAISIGNSTLVNK